MIDNLICLGGVHGVGKSTFCTNLVNLNSQIEYISASRVINAQNKNSKIVNNINANQILLIEGLKSIQSDSKASILDSHFTLLSGNNSIEEIPLIFFEQINPKSIVVLYDNPSRIKHKWEIRDQIKIDLDFIIDFQNKEVNYSQQVANSLRINFLKLDINDTHALNKLIDFVI